MITCFLFSGKGKFNLLRGRCFDGKQNRTYNGIKKSLNISKEPNTNEIQTIHLPTVLFILVKFSLISLAA